MLEAVGKRKFKQCAQESAQHLDAGRSVRHGWYQITNAMSDLVAYIDGGSFGNPGPSGIGVVISGSADGTIRIARWIGQQDNNVAEYVALLEALQCALLLKAKALRVFSDSEVMVKQMSGEYSCRSPRLYSLNWICRKLARSVDFSISHVRRENNTEAKLMVWPVRLPTTHNDASGLAERMNSKTSLISKVRLGTPPRPWRHQSLHIHRFSAGPGLLL